MVSYDYLAFAKNFVLDGQFLSLLASTLILFLAIFIAWYFYHKQLAKRDLFEIPKISSSSKVANFFNRLLYFLKYLLIFPTYSFIWFLIFSFMLFLLSKSRPVEEIMFFGITVVAATRISAYVSGKLAEDMAKLLPWALIVVYLTDPKAITIEGALSSFETFINHVPKVAKYLIFIVAVEWLLRIGYWIFSPKKEPQ